MVSYINAQVCLRCLSSRSDSPSCSISKIAMATSSPDESSLAHTQCSRLWISHLAKGNVLYANMLSAARYQQPDRPSLSLSVFTSTDGHTTATENVGTRCTINSYFADADKNAHFNSDIYPSTGVFAAVINRRGLWNDQIEANDDEETIQQRRSNWVPWHWSQVAWQHWKIACAASQVSLDNLSRVDRRHIETPITQALCREAAAPFLDASQPLQDVQITFLPHQQEFMVLLATANCSGVAYLCQENNNALGGKVVQKITLHWDGGGLNILIDIGPESSHASGPPPDTSTPLTTSAETGDTTEV